MTRISKNLFVAAALLAAPASSAFAQDADQPAEDTATATEGTDGTATTTSTEPATTDDSAGSVSATTGGEAGWAIVDRSLTLGASKLAFQADIGIAHVSLLGASATSELLAIGAGYGVNEKLTVGGTYAFALNEFEIKGPLTLYGAYNITNNGKLSVAGSVDIEVDPSGADTAFAIDAGLAVRYKLAPKFAVYTGNPYTPGPSGQHLHLGLSGDESKTFSIPVGLAFQATPQLYLHVDTTVATISLSDPGMGSRVISYGDIVPFSIGGWFNVNKNLDVGASFNALDLPHVGDFWTITLGGRYYL